MNQSIDEIASSHAFLAGKLHFEDFKLVVGCGDIEVVLLCVKSARSLSLTVSLLCLVNLHDSFTTVRKGDICPCTRYWGETAHEVMTLLHAIVPVYLTCFVEYLRGRM